MQILLYTLIVTILDQITKYFVVQELSYENMVIINGILEFTYVQNTGGAFSILQNGKLFFLIVTPVVIAAILFYVFKQRERNDLLLSAAGLIMGGAVGNYIDRIRLGYVIDFIDFKVWPVFNVADSAIVIGTCIFAYYLLFISDKANNQEENKSGEN